MIARFTPAVPVAADGRVHSVFEHAANILLNLPAGERMITLLHPALPRVPDGIQAPEELIAHLQPDMPAALTADALILAGTAYPITRLSAADFYLTCEKRALHQGALNLFLQLTEGMPTGFDRLPRPLRDRAEAALCTPDAGRYIGLGAGLTPSFDDACVGMLAMCRALGKAPAFTPNDLAATTDVSARYLRLAREGYFGEALLSVIRALQGHGDLRAAVSDLEKVGAASGRDMMFGMRRALLAHGDA